MREKSSYEYLLSQIVRRVFFGSDINLTDEQVEELSGMIKKASKTPNDEIALRNYYGLDCERISTKVTAQKICLSAGRVQQLRYRTERSLVNILVSQRKFVVQSSTQKKTMESMEQEIRVLREKITELRSRTGFGHPGFDDCVTLTELVNEISVRARHAAERHGIRTLGELAQLTKGEILNIKNIGWKTLEEIENLLKKYGLHLADHSKEKSPLEKPIVFNRHAPNIGELLKHISVDALYMSVRTSNCLEEGGIKNIAQLINKKDDDLIAIRNFGKTCLKEVKKKLFFCGLK